MQTVDIQVAPNFAEIQKGRKAGKSIIALQGSSSSGKTWSVLDALILYAMENKNKTIRGFRYDRAACRDSVAKDFLEMMQEERWKLYEPARWNKSEMTYEFPTGTKMIFVGAQDPTKLKGPRQDVAFLNEAMEISKESFDQIDARTKDFTILDFNPALLQSWCYDLEKDTERVHYYRSTFRENPGLPEKSRQTILSWEPTPANKQRGTADSYMWDVYGLGKVGMKEGAIYKLWKETEFWPERMACERYGFGLDFGFVDPNALVECALFQGEIYLREWVFEKDLSIQEHPQDPSMATLEGRMKELGVPKDVRIHADNARPEAIKALRASGYQVIPSVKGAGSVLDGINLIKSFPVRIHAQSQNLKIAWTQYSWKKHGIHGSYSDVPDHDYSDLPDAVRYWASAEIKPTRHNNPRRMAYSNTTKGRRF